MLNSDTLLEIKNLSVGFKRYGGTAQVLEKVSLHLNPSEKLGLVGETGCGKSLTVKMLMGLLPVKKTIVPADSSILYKGNDILHMNRKQRAGFLGKEIVMIFQDPMSSLNPVFTIGEQMEEVLWWNTHAKCGFNGRLERKFDKAKRLQVRSIIEESLRAVRLTDTKRVMNSYPFQLSGGMRQRVLIAMALSSQPNLLIADEPGTALDVTTQRQTLSLLDELVNQRRIAVLMITHNLGMVRESTHRVYVMYAGRIVEHGYTSEIFGTPLHPYTHGLLASVPRLTAQGIGKGIEGTVPDYLYASPACRFHNRCEYAKWICREEMPSLKAISPEHSVACFKVQKDERYV